MTSNKKMNNNNSLLLCLSVPNDRVTAETPLIYDTDYRPALCSAQQRGVACHAFASPKRNKFNLAHQSLKKKQKNIKLCINLSNGLTGKRKRALSDLCNLFI